MTDAVAYWDAGIDAVPQMTGADQLLDAADMVAVCSRLGVELPLRDVLDVGCGTGRLAKLCEGYIGADIAPSAVEYCRREGLSACAIEGPKDLPAGPFEIIACLSVFTHISRVERQRYLAAFAERTNRLLIDIIPGKEGGDIALWRADPDEFVADLASAGFVVEASTQGEGVSVSHAYYSAVRL